MLNTPITIDTIVADHELGALAQEQVNDAERNEPGSALPLVRLLADAKHLGYPQYRGHWDGAGWTLYRITRRIETKLGVAFEAGDVTIGYRYTTRLTTARTITLYSLRNGCETSIDAWSGAAQKVEG